MNRRCSERENPTGIETNNSTTEASGYYAIDVATGTYLVNAELAGYVFTPTTIQVWSGMVSPARPVVGRPDAT